MSQKIIVRESKRTNAGYRKHALASLGDFVQADVSTDWYEQVYAIVLPIAEEIMDGADEMDVDSQEANGSSSKSM